MNAIILGGMSPRHHDWVRQVSDALQPHFETVKFLDYKHWEVPGAEMDLEHEVLEVQKLTSELDTYIVVAKSIGTVVTALSIGRKLLSPEYCVFMGLPLKVIEAEIPAMKTALTQLPPTHFIHNEDDPLGSADAVKNYIETYPPEQYDLLVAPGNTHDYVDYKLIIDLALG